MRVISQDRMIDLNYDLAAFYISDYGNDEFIIYADIDGRNYIMGEYYNKQEAIDALEGMSNNYIRFIVTDKNNTDIVTDEIFYSMDKPFEHIDVRTLNASVYKFPQAKVKETNHEQTEEKSS